MNTRSGSDLVRPPLLSVDDAAAMDPPTVAELFGRHVSPGQLRMMELLGTDRMLIDRAEGVHYVDHAGRRLLDFFGGFGALALGHNHPRLLSVRRRFAEEHRHEIGLAFPSQYATALARNLAVLAPGDLDMVLLCCTGSEAVEAALKLAERAQGPRRRQVAYAENSFHGKTRGALSVTDSVLYRADFRLVAGDVRVPFGDAAALDEVLRRDRRIGAVILETVQGGAGIVVPPHGYLRAVREICDAHGVLWIADEVQCGVGRTGRFFAFEHAGVVPDVVTLAKSLGGGKAAVGAMIARGSLYRKAYGSRDSAMIHGTATFGGMGEACCTALETLTVLYDEGLIDNAARQGNYLLDRLRGLQRRHPGLIKEVRGAGLMVGVEFADVSALLPGGLRRAVGRLDDPLRGSICLLVGSLLLAEFGVLVAFTEYNRNVIRLEPPLVIGAEHIDQLVDGLDRLLARGVVRLVRDYLRTVQGWKLWMRGQDRAPERPLAAAE